MNIALLRPSKSTHDRLRNWKEVARLKQQLNTLGNVLPFLFLSRLLKQLWKRFLRCDASTFLFRGIISTRYVNEKEAEGLD